MLKARVVRGLLLRPHRDHRAAHPPAMDAVFLALQGISADTFFTTKCAAAEISCNAAGAFAETKGCLPMSLRAMRPLAATAASGRGCKCPSQNDALLHAPCKPSEQI